MVNYNNAVIYKIYCKNTAITDCYVGSTCDYMGRKNSHKSNCNNENKSKSYNLNVYKFIRENGGWDNWEMIELIKYPCNTQRELALKEREYIELLGGTLNKQIPTRSKAEYDKAYDLERKEEKRERDKARYQKNKELNEKINCECGSIILKSGKSGHLKTEKHKQYLELN